MKFGVDEADAFIDEALSKKDNGRDRTFSGRKNSMDQLLGPLSLKNSGRDKKKIKNEKDGLINTFSSDDKSGISKKSPNSNITVSKMSKGSSEEYERIVESDGESGSSRNNSSFDGTDSERAHNREMKDSNIFLMKVMHGRVPNELLTSRITSTDRENLSTLIPHLILGKQDSESQFDNLTYMDVYEASKTNSRATEISQVNKKDYKDYSTLIAARDVQASAEFGRKTAIEDDGSFLMKGDKL